MTRLPSLLSDRARRLGQAQLREAGEAKRELEADVARGRQERERSLARLAALPKAVETLQVTASSRAAFAAQPSPPVPRQLRVHSALAMCRDPRAAICPPSPASSPRRRSVLEHAAGAAD